MNTLQKLYLSLESSVEWSYSDLASNPCIPIDFKLPEIPIERLLHRDITVDHAKQLIKSYDLTNNDYIRRLQIQLSAENYLTINDWIEVFGNKLSLIDNLPIHYCRNAGKIGISDRIYYSHISIASSMPWKKLQYYVNNRMLKVTSIPYIFLNSSVTLYIIEINKYLQVCMRNYDKCWEMLSHNPNISMYYVNEYKHKNWSMRALSLNLSISLEDIYDNPDIEWNYPSCIGRPDITADFIINIIPLTTPDKYCLLAYYMVANSVFKFDILKPLIDKLYSLTRQTVMIYLSRNASLTYDNIINNKYEWQYYILSKNKFELSNIHTKIKKARETRMSNRKLIHDISYEILGHDISIIIVNYVYFGDESKDISLSSAVNKLVDLL